MKKPSQGKGVPPVGITGTNSKIISQSLSTVMDAKTKVSIANPSQEANPKEAERDPLILVQEECKLMKEHLLKCQDVSAKSSVMKACIAAIEYMQATVVTVVSSPSPRLKHRGGLAIVFLRSLLLDFPLMFLFGLYLSSELLLHFQTHFFFPQIKLMEWTEERKNSIELTYYERHCSINDVSTNRTETLLLPHDISPTDAAHHMIEHGVQIYPHILTASTANAVRNFILDRNPKEENFFVIANKGRFSFGVDVHSDPSIEQALKEIANHASLVPALEQIIGPDPAIIEFTAITSVFGAEAQHFHQDVVPSGSAFKYARNFLPSYSLFIPLQDITSEMGPTEVCPGTHVCQDSARNFCSAGSAVRLANGDQHWKRGFGALVNQQLFHRGTEHVMEGGPERVLFILTLTPRPRWGKNQVEARMIGHSGSYSIKWNQWGHTLSDFGSVKTKMAEPFMTARALGLYAPTTKAWGWDMVTVASMRIANGDNGYSEDDLENFVTVKGGFTWLPIILKEPTKDNDTWPDWIERQTVKIKEYLKYTNKYVVLGYLAFMAVIHIVLWFRPSIGHGHILERAILRLILLYGIVTVALYLVLQRVEKSQWAENIKYGKAFVGVHKADTPLLPGTIPVDLDVLKGDRYSSPYLGSYNDMIQMTHPGNKIWSQVVSHYAQGFSVMPAEIQRDICARIVHSANRVDYGRILTQNEIGNWAVMPNDEAVRVCHKELIQLDDIDDLIGRMVRHLDYMISETRHGVWRDHSIHKVHVKDFLIKLQDKIMSLPKRKTSASRNSMNGLNMNVTVVNSPFGIKFVSTQPPRSTANLKPSSPRIPLSEPKSDLLPPFRSAWIVEGDRVDGQYQGSWNEWYSATVLTVSCNDGVIDAVYDDGMIDPGLCRLCVRPFLPFEIDEPVAARDKDDIFYGGRIVKLYTTTNTYDIQTTDNGLMKNVSTADIRRFDWTMQRGTRVEAKFQGVGEIWYPGKIIAEHDDGSYDVEYDDGDTEYEVEREHIRIAA